MINNILCIMASIAMGLIIYFMMGIMGFIDPGWGIFVMICVGAFFTIQLMQGAINSIAVGK